MTSILPQGNTLQMRCQPNPRQTRNNYLGAVRVGDLEIPKLAEFTFLRKDRTHDQGFVQTFPHHLDCDNTNNPHLPLPPCWY